MAVESTRHAERFDGLGLVEMERDGAFTGDLRDGGSVALAEKGDVRERLARELQEQEQEEETGTRLVSMTPPESKPVGLPLRDSDETQRSRQPERAPPSPRRIPRRRGFFRPGGRPARR
jgi:hypothetical protein